MHYTRVRVHGDPSKTIYYRDPEEALIARRERDGSCELWTGTLCKQGYGRIKMGDKMVSVHRLIWEREHGEIPDGMEIDHICHRRNCMVVEHMRLATRAQQNANLNGAKRSNRSTGVRNVYPERRKFKVMVKNQYFGLYSTIEEAAEVAAKKRRELFGEFDGNG